MGSKRDQCDQLIQDVSDIVMCSYEVRSVSKEESVSCVKEVNLLDVKNKLDRLKKHVQTFEGDGFEKEPLRNSWTEDVGALQLSKDLDSIRQIGKHLGLKAPAPSPAKTRQTRLVKYITRKQEQCHGYFQYNDSAVEGHKPSQMSTEGGGPKSMLKSRAENFARHLQSRLRSLSESEDGTWVSTGSAGEQVSLSSSSENEAFFEIDSNITSPEEEIAEPDYLTHTNYVDDLSTSPTDIRLYNQENKRDSVEEQFFDTVDLDNLNRSKESSPKLEETVACLCKPVSLPFPIPFSPSRNHNHYKYYPEASHLNGTLEKTYLDAELSDSAYESCSKLEGKCNRPVVVNYNGCTKLKADMAEFSDHLKLKPEVEKNDSKELVTIEKTMNKLQSDSKEPKTYTQNTDSSSDHLQLRNTEGSNSKACKTIDNETERLQYVHSELKPYTQTIDSSSDHLHLRNTEESNSNECKTFDKENERMPDVPMELNSHMLNSDLSCDHLKLKNINKSDSKECIVFKNEIEILQDIPKEIKTCTQDNDFISDLSLSSHQQNLEKQTSNECGKTTNDQIDIHLQDEEKLSLSDLLQVIHKELKLEGKQLNTPLSSNSGTTHPEINISEVSPESQSSKPSKTIAEDEEEDIETRRLRFRRCSSLKSGKTPPGTPGRKKIVRFADVLGLDLADVKTFLDEVPTIPKSAYEDLYGVESSTPPTTDTFGRISQRKERVVIPLFQQPGGHPNFLEKVRAFNVCLENAAVTDPTLFAITGTVRVKNIDFHKSVHIRYTLNGWKSFADLQARYVPNSCDGFSDKFSFLVYAHTLSVGQRLEFAVRFQARGTQFWDNNGGVNYVFECVNQDNPCITAAPLMPSSPTDSWPAFY